MKSRINFWLLATPVIWIVVVAPIAALLAWWLSFSTLKVLAWSTLAAPLVCAWIFLSFQTSNLIIKWPATQLIGLATVLMNVVVVCCPLLLFLPSRSVALTATSLWVIISIYAIWKAHNVLDTSISVSSEKLKRSYRIMHLSDLHAGSRSKAFINKVTRQTMQHQPDIVLITGDVLDSSDVDTQYLEPLSQFTCPVYLCLGNHERYVDLQNAIDAIQANNVTILRSESALFDTLEIVGIDDADDPDQVAKELVKISRDKTRFQILMYHRPHGFKAAAANGIDLMLSGHTHAGQMWPFGLLVKRQFPLIKGRYQESSSTLYVSQGTGTWGPVMRLGTSSEMTLINLTPK